MPRRVDINALVTMHGVSGLARKVGVHRRTVQRWQQEGGSTDPSPLAIQKLKGVMAEMQPRDENSPTVESRGPQRRISPRQNQQVPEPPLSGGVVPARRMS